MTQEASRCVVQRNEIQFVCVCWKPFLSLIHLQTTTFPEISEISLSVSPYVCVYARVLVCRWYRLSSHTHKGPWISIYLFCLFSPSVMWNMLSNNTVWSCNSHNQSVIHISFYIKWKFSHDFLPFSVTLAILLSVFVSSFLLGSVDLMPMKRSVTFSRCFFFSPCTLDEIESV